MSIPSGVSESSLFNSNQRATKNQGCHAFLTVFPAGFHLLEMVIMRSDWSDWSIQANWGFSHRLILATDKSSRLIWRWSVWGISTSHSPQGGSNWSSKSVNWWQNYMMMISVDTDMSVIPTSHGPSGVPTGQCQIGNLGLFRPICSQIKAFHRLILAKAYDDDHWSPSGISTSHGPQRGSNWSSTLIMQYGWSTEAKMQPNLRVSSVSEQNHIWWW